MELFPNLRVAFLTEEGGGLSTGTLHLAGEPFGNEFRFRVTYTLSSNV